MRLEGSTSQLGLDQTEVASPEEFDFDLGQYKAIWYDQVKIRSAFLCHSFGRHRSLLALQSASTAASAADRLGTYWWSQTEI